VMTELRLTKMDGDASPAAKTELLMVGTVWIQHSFQEQ